MSTIRENVSNVYSQISNLSSSGNFSELIARLGGKGGIKENNSNQTANCGCQAPDNDCPTGGPDSKSDPKPWVERCLNDWPRTCIPKAVDGAKDQCGFPGVLSDENGQPLKGLVVVDKIESQNVGTLEWDAASGKYKLAGTSGPGTWEVQIGPNGLPSAVRNEYNYFQMDVQAIIYDKSTDSFVYALPAGFNNFRIVGGPADQASREEFEERGLI